MNAESLLPWFPPTGDETMATVDHRDVLLVAGVDPYAFKGTTDIVHPYVRPHGSRRVTEPQLGPRAVHGLGACPRLSGRTISTR
jgi:hypothetical protein